VVFALLLGGLSFGAKLFKKTSRNFKTSIIWEWTFLALFAVFAIIAIFPFSHYFVVSEKKVELKDKLSHNVSEAKRLFKEYDNYVAERDTIYAAELDNAIKTAWQGTKKIYIKKTKYDNYGFEEGMDDNAQKQRKIDALRRALSNYRDNENRNFPYDSIKNTALKKLDNAQDAIDSWQPINLVKYVIGLDKNIETWRNQLVSMSKQRQTGEEINNFDDSKIVTNNVNAKLQKKPKDLFFATNLMAICWVLGLYVIMLMSYFITRRHTRYPGLKVIFSTGRTSINEL